MPSHDCIKHSGYNCNRITFQPKGLCVLRKTKSQTNCFYFLKYISFKMWATSILHKYDLIPLHIKLSQNFLSTSVLSLQSQEYMSLPLWNADPGLEEGNAHVTLSCYSLFLFMAYLEMRSIVLLYYTILVGSCLFNPT